MFLLFYELNFIATINSICIVVNPALAGHTSTI